MLKPFLSAIFTIWLALTLVFIGLRVLPGNAIQAQLAGSGLPPSVVQDRLSASGLDQPLLTQYANYLRDLLHADLGRSLYTGQTVNEILAARWPVTVTLASFALLWTLLIGLTLGLIAGLASRPFALLGRTFIDLSLSIPVYVTLTLSLFLLVRSRDNLALPAIILGFHTAGAVASLIETRLTELRSAPYIRTAQAKGLPHRTIIRRHMLALALMPAIPVIALQAGILFSGAVITETIFGLSGLGLLLLDAVLQRNYPVVQGVVLIVVVTVISLNTLADLLQRWLDPRLSIV